ncbi:unnamed protein product, partial [Ectocarpus sp. 6 AP-2014]
AHIRETITPSNDGSAKIYMPWCWRRCRSSYRHGAAWKRHGLSRQNHGFARCNVTCHHRLRQPSVKGRDRRLKMLRRARRRLRPLKITKAGHREKLVYYRD